MKVAIFGTGPAGLAAAHGVRTVDPKAEIALYGTRMQPSRLNGCQYLHAPLPGVGDQQGRRVAYTLQGTREQYAEKVYGPEYNGQVSVDDYEGTHEAWDLRSAYADLWVQYAGLERYDGVSLHKTSVDVPWLASFPFEEFHYVISTIPAKGLCFRDCTFASESVWAAGDAPGLQLLSWAMPDDTIVCNGLENPSWYRSANVFGHKTREWPGHIRRPFADDVDVVSVEKPLFTNCRCWQQNGKRITRMGRYGQWSKRAYVHDCFVDAIRLITFGKLGEQQPKAPTAPDGGAW